MKPDIPHELNKVNVRLSNAYINITGRVITELYRGLENSRGISTVYITDRRTKESKIHLSEEDWFNSCDLLALHYS